MSVQIIRCPQRIQRARLFRVQPQPRLPAAAPVEQTHRAGVQVPAASPHVVPTQTVLVPPVVNRRHVSREHQQKRRERPELVDPGRPALLDLHPPLDPLRVPEPPPFTQIDHHHPRVEVARAPTRKRARITIVRPETGREVLREVRVAVLRRSDCFPL